VRVFKKITARPESRKCIRCFMNIPRKIIVSTRLELNLCAVQMVSQPIYPTIFNVSV